LYTIQDLCLHFHNCKLRLKLLWQEIVGDVEFFRIIGEIPIITLTDLPSTCFVQSWLGAYSGRLEKIRRAFVGTTQSPEAEATLGNSWNITQVAASIGQALNMSAEETH
ncbi:hypothetical protein Tco_0260643, partial [Tanacetum coccineum]